MKLWWFVRLPLLLSLAVAIVMPGNAQRPTSTRATAAGDATVPTMGTAFRIGCLRYDPDTRVSIDLIQQLSTYLRSQERVQAAMRLEGVSEIQVQSFDAHRWLMEAMDAEQVDLAFCSLIDYVYQTGNYTRVFQLRLPHDPPARDRLYFRGSIFVNNHSSLFNMSHEEADARLPQYLAANEIALVGPHSAAGYVYPLLHFYKVTSGTGVQPRAQFWGSSEEVVKAVLNGSAEIGACDSGVIEAVLKASNLWDRRQELYKEVGPKPQIVRDPVALLQRWAPQTSPLGLAIRDATRRYFNQLKPPLPQVMPSPSESQFDEVPRAILDFDRLRKAAESAAK